MSVDKILPPRATPLERSFVRGLYDVLPVPLREIVDPDETPAAFVPWLASHESVDLWFDDWPLSRKRAMVKEAPTLAWKKGTRDGSRRFLSYVDGRIERAIAYPSRFVMGRAKVGPTPIGHPAFLARYLLKVDTTTPLRALVGTRAVLGRHRLKTPSREKFRRCYVALRASKAPETQYLADFAYKRPLRLSDGAPLNGQFHLGDHVSTKYGVNAPLHPAPAALSIVVEPPAVDPNIWPAAAALEITTYKPSLT